MHNRKYTSTGRASGGLDALQLYSATRSSCCTIVGRQRMLTPFIERCRQREQKAIEPTTRSFTRDLRYATCSCRDLTDDDGTLRTNFPLLLILMAKSSRSSKTEKSRQAKHSSSKSTIRNSRVTVSGPARPNTSGARRGCAAEKAAATDDVASAFPFNPNGNRRRNRGRCQPRSDTSSAVRRVGLTRWNDGHQRPS